MAITNSPKPVLQALAASVVFFGAFMLLRPTESSTAHPLSTARARNAVLVELFTSEGCSSCPPADALLGRLRQDLGNQGLNVIPLGFHVDYWNSLGWRDRFSSAEFSRRQEQYARALGTDGPYTPQMIVDGGIEFVGSDAARAQSAIIDGAGQPQTTRIELSVLADHPRFLDLPVRISSSAKGADVMLAITEDNLVTKVGGGENIGHELRHTAVVRELRRLGSITDSGNFRADVPIELRLDWKRNDLQLVVFVQESPAGKVLGAASVSLHAQQR
ncbi:MAG TPA: DUF1223 domain-containing protein [Candidatus Angelobacter sp.]|nr:DUF1223 domain-containing protein [Candidatus Angelobacter sp.]